MKKVGITGGLGFIGSHLTEMLVGRGIEVVIVDNCISSVVNREFLSDSGKVTVYSSPISDIDLTECFCGADTVFHLASILGPSGVLSYAGELGKSILLDTIRVRDACVRLNATMVDISTSEVYGHPGLLREDSEKVFSGVYKIRGEYGAGKMLSEMSVVNYSAVRGKPKYHFIRPFNVTGPRQKPDGGFVLPRFVIAALTGQPITVYGDGLQVRAYTHVLDICTAILEIVESGYSNEIWNVGNPNNEKSILDTANLVVSKVKEKFPDKRPDITFIDPKDIHGPLFSEAVDKVPYIEKIQNLIGWEPEYSAERIVSDVIEYYSKKIESGYYFSVLGYN